LSIGVLSALPSAVVIVLVSLLMSLVSVLAYKFFTDQIKLKSIQDEQKKLREEMKKHKDDSKKVMKLNKRAMELSMEMMPQTFKSMMITIIPLFLVFSWLGANFAFEPIQPGEVFNTTVEFEKAVDVNGEVVLSVSEGLVIVGSANQGVVDNKVTWQLKGDEGTYALQYEYEQEMYQLDVMISDANSGAQPKLEKQKKIFFVMAVGDGIPKESSIKSIRVDLNSARPLGSFSIFGMHPSWLAVYILSSLVFSMVLRKVLKVY